MPEVRLGAAMRYVEQKPVRAGLVDGRARAELFDPEDWRRILKEATERSVLREWEQRT
jgi:hypothetical protein